MFDSYDDTDIDTEDLFDDGADPDTLAAEHAAMTADTVHAILSAGADDYDIGDDYDY